MPNFGNVFSLQTCLNGRSQFLKVISELKEIQAAAVSHLQSFPASGFFLMSQFFSSGGQSIGASATASVLPMNIQDRFPLEWTDWISLQSKGLSRVFSNTTVQKHQFFGTHYVVQLSHLYMTTGKTIALTRWTFLGKVMSLFFNMLCRLVIAFLPRSKHLLSIFEPSENPTKATKQGLFFFFFGGVKDISLQRWGEQTEDNSLLETGKQMGKWKL